VELLYLSRSDVESVGLTLAEMVDAVDAMFREKGQGRVELPPKPGIHLAGDAFIHAMPAWVPGARALALKWVSAFPGNREEGLPQIMGLIVLNDPETGAPLAVMDCTWITAMRTAAATAVAARYLARRDSRTLAVIACGVQGRSNTEALIGAFPLRAVRAYDHRPENTERYAAEMERRFGVPVTPVGSPREAMVGADLVVTSGPIRRDPEPAIRAGWLEPGGFACALDFDSYWSPEAMESMDLLTTDDVKQLDYYRGVGYFAATPGAVEDLGRISAGLAGGRRTAEERILAIHLGLASEDAVTARLVYDRAVERGIGRFLPL
jgi:ornithine cyclodeaminase/alanine dehydrogenase